MNEVWLYSSSDFTRAELRAVLLGDMSEVGSAFENHAAYLRHWVRLLREPPGVLFQVLGAARQAVLENLGWEIYRIWSTDWFENAEAETRKLVAHLKTLNSRL